MDITRRPYFIDIGQSVVISAELVYETSLTEQDLRVLVIIYRHFSLYYIYKLRLLGYTP